MGGMVQWQEVHAFSVPAFPCIGIIPKWNYYRHRECDCAMQGEEQQRWGRGNIDLTLGCEPGKSLAKGMLEGQYALPI